MTAPYSPERGLPEATGIDTITHLAQHALVGAMGPLSVESFRNIETPRQRVARYVSTVIHGRYAHTSRKPDQYDTRYYGDHVGNTVQRVVEQSGEMPDELYGAAEEATAFLGADPSREDYTFQTNDPRGAESVAVLRAVTHNPSFIATDPQRAARVLAGLGRTTYSVCHDLFTHYDGNRSREVLNDGFSRESLPAFAALVGQDALWQRDNNGQRASDAHLSSLAQALAAISEVSPLGSIDARLDMLTRNELHGSSAIIKYHLVYTFKTDIEQDRLRAIATNSQTPDVTRGIINDILGGRWDGVAWAI